MTLIELAERVLGRSHGTVGPIPVGNDGRQPFIVRGFVRDHGHGLEPGSVGRANQMRGRPAAPAAGKTPAPRGSSAIFLK